MYVLFYILVSSLIPSRNFTTDFWNNSFIIVLSRYLSFLFCCSKTGHTHVHPTLHSLMPGYISIWVKQKKGTANSLTVHRNGRRVKRKWLPFPVVENFPGAAGTHSQLLVAELSLQALFFWLACCWKLVSDASCLPSPPHTMQSWWQSPPAPGVLQKLGAHHAFCTHLQLQLYPLPEPAQGNEWEFLRWFGKAKERIMALHTL